jgi:hypothetical protein
MCVHDLADTSLILVCGVYGQEPLPSQQSTVFADPSLALDARAMVSTVVTALVVNARASASTSASSDPSVMISESTLPRSPIADTSTSIVSPPRPTPLVLDADAPQSAMAIVPVQPAVGVMEPNVQHSVEAAQVSLSSPVLTHSSGTPPASRAIKLAQQRADYLARVEHDRMRLQPDPRAAGSPLGLAGSTASLWPGAPTVEHAVVAASLVAIETAASATSPRLRPAPSLRTSPRPSLAPPVTRPRGSNAPMSLSPSPRSGSGASSQGSPVPTSTLTPMSVLPATLVLARSSPDLPPPAFAPGHALPTPTPTPVVMDRSASLALNLRLTLHDAAPPGTPPSQPQSAATATATTPRHISPLPSPSSNRSSLSQRLDALGDEPAGQLYSVSQVLNTLPVQVRYSASNVQHLYRFFKARWRKFFRHFSEAHVQTANGDDSQVLGDPQSSPVLSANGRIDRVSNEMPDSGHVVSPAPTQSAGSSTDQQQRLHVPLEFDSDSLESPTSSTKLPRRPSSTRVSLVPRLTLPLASGGPAAPVLTSESLLSSASTPPPGQRPTQSRESVILTPSTLVSMATGEHAASPNLSSASPRLSVSVELPPGAARSNPR